MIVTLFVNDTFYDNFHFAWKQHNFQSILAQLRIFHFHNDFWQRMRFPAEKFSTILIRLYSWTIAVESDECVHLILYLDLIFFYSQSIEGVHVATVFVSNIGFEECNVAHDWNPKAIT